MSGFPLNGYFYIKSQAVESCLDVYNGAVEPDAALIIWPLKSEDNDNQLWRYEDGFLVNKKSNLVMDVRGGDLSSDKPLVQYDRKMTMAHNQRWGYRDGFIYILADPRLVLDIKGGRTKDGTKVILYERKESDTINQRWSIVPYGNYAQQTPQEALSAYPMPAHYQQGQGQGYPQQGQGQGYYQQGQPQGNYGGYGPPDDQNSRYSSASVLPYEQASEAHRQVYTERKAHLSHQVIAGAAGYEAVKAYIRHQESQGTPVNHQFAKKAIAGIVAAQMVKFAEEHQWSSRDKEQATREAEQAADQYYTREVNAHYG
ncbi:ricin B lectin domain-containing protein [Spinellus fusiger]|nr:ricin B lectin domain-containing protein [Spinellus fusiger]